MSLPQQIADAIVAAGVPRAFGIPGGGPSLELVDALDRAGVPFFTTAFEGSAAIMAGVTGRLTGCAGVAVAIKGPGLGNLLAGMAACRLESWPAVTISEAYGPGTPVSRAHKRLDHDLAVAGIAKAYGGAGGGGYAAAAELAEQESPGPVAIDLVEAAPPALPAPPAGVFDRGAAMAALARSRRPIVVAGTLAIRLRLADRLAALGVPTFSTAAAKGVLDERLAHAAGLFTGVGLSLSPEAALLAEADLVIGIGLRGGELLGYPTLPIVNVDPLGAEALPGVGSIVVPLDALDDILAGAPRWGGDVVADALARMRSGLLEGPFLVAQAVDTLARALPDARLVVDTGYFCTIAEHMWTATASDRFLGSGAGRSMGIGLPMAVAAALHDRQRPTICATGDGGLPMFIGEFAQAIRQRLPLLVVHMNDGGFGSIRPRARSGGLTLRPLESTMSSWRGAFDGMGVPSWSVDDAASLDAAVKAWRAGGGPGFVEVTFESRAYEQMCDRLRG